MDYFSFTLFCLHCSFWYYNSFFVNFILFFFYFSHFHFLTSFCILFILIHPLCPFGLFHLRRILVIVLSLSCTSLFLFLIRLFTLFDNLFSSMIMRCVHLFVSLFSLFLFILFPIISLHFIFYFVRYFFLFIYSACPSLLLSVRVRNWAREGHRRYSSS